MSETVPANDRAIEALKFLVEPGQSCILLNVVVVVKLLYLLYLRLFIHKISIIRIIF